MPQDRPAIPSHIRRAVLIEARHACAICAYPLYELHHIIPWSESHEHKLEDLIALCPNCHTRVERGEIDKKSLREYKSKLPHSHRSYATLPSGFHRQSALPAPPVPYIAHPYVLLEAQTLFGRNVELEDLNRWCNVANAPASPIYIVTGIGGQGKSALTWKWFNSAAAREAKFGFAIWWSFYESDASFDNFVTRAIAYLSGDAIEDVSKREAIDRDNQLLDLLREKSCLLVLDGFERQLVAYNTDESSTALIETSRRAAWSQRVAIFLQAIAEIGSLRVLISTRLFPSDLETVTATPRPGVIRRDLSGLQQEDALAMWRSFGLEGEEDRVAAIFRVIDFHPLVIRALASQVSCYRASPGNTDAWLDANPGFEPLSAGDSAKAMQHVLGYALRDLSEECQDLLLTVALQYAPSQYGALDAIHIGEGKTFPNEQQLDDALSELEDRGLLGWDRASNRYDAHPIVRTTVIANVNPAKTRIAYEALESHFSAFPIADQDVRSLDDLAPIISRYNALINLGRYEDAYAVLCTSRNETGLYRFVTGNECARLLEMMRPEGFNSLPKLKDASAQRMVLCMLGNSYYHSGETSRAIAVDEQWRDARIRDNSEAAERDIDLSYLLVQVGRLHEAETILLIHASKQNNVPTPTIQVPAMPRRFAELSESQRAFFEERQRVQLNEARRVAVERSTLRASQSLRRSCSMLASIHGIRGQWELAAEYIGKAQSTLTPRYTTDLVNVFLHKAESALFCSKYDVAYEAATFAKVASIAVKSNEGECQASTCLARCLIKKDELKEARQQLERALELCKTEELLYGEAGIMVDRGNLALCENDIEQALQDGQAARVLARRLEQKIELALALVLLARCEQARGNRDQAIAYGMEAFTIAMLQGSPYAFEFGITQAREVLTELGAAERCPPVTKMKMRSQNLSATSG